MSGRKTVIGTNGLPVRAMTGRDARQPNNGYKSREPAYRVETAIEICKRISRGETLKSICEEPNMPSKSAFLDWVDADFDRLADRYTTARAKLMDHWADEIVAIADDQTAEPNDRRVRVETRKWLMSKLAYRRYGDKLIHSGDPENPLVIAHRRVAEQALDPEQLEAISRLVEARLGGPVIDVEAHSVENYADNPD